MIELFTDLKLFMGWDVSFRKQILDELKKGYDLFGDCFNDGNANCLQLVGTKTEIDKNMKDAYDLLTWCGRISEFQKVSEILAHGWKAYSVSFNDISLSIMFLKI